MTEEKKITVEVSAKQIREALAKYERRDEGSISEEMELNREKVERIIEKIGTGAELDSEETQLWGRIAYKVGSKLSNKRTRDIVVVSVSDIVFEIVTPDDERRAGPKEPKK